jgi:hypothetical protein
MLNNMIDLNQIDTILYFNSNINEAVDDRNYATKPWGGVDRPIKGQYIDYIDPKLYASWSFGRQLRNELNNMGSGFTCEVSDFGKEIVARVTHSDPVTARSASKTFLITFTGNKGDAFVKSHSNKWRSISGISQAAQYIKSVCSNLSASTQQKM